MSALPSTTQACLSRLEEVTHEMERLARFEHLTQPQEERADELSRLTSAIVKVVGQGSAT